MANKGESVLDCMRDLFFVFSCNIWKSEKIDLHWTYIFSTQVDLIICLGMYEKRGRNKKAQVY